MDKKDFQHILRKYRAGTADIQERRLVDEWFAQLDTESQELSPEEKLYLQESIKNNIDLQIGSRPNKSIWKYYVTAAASLLLMLSLGFLFWQNAQDIAPMAAEPEIVIVTADPGKLKNITLPDSSKVWLNSGSKLRFTLPFDTENTRIVHVEYGEVFFDVKPDSIKPFVVHTENLTTRVLGTSFTVKAYPNVEDIQISVLTGLVEVSQEMNAVLSSLKKGDQLVYNRFSERSFVRQVETDRSNSWIAGITYLSQASFAELAQIIENGYGIILEAGHSHIKDQKYSIQLDRKTPIVDIINAICDLYKNNYRKEDNRITIY